MKKNVLVTGGAGFIGSQITTDLIREKFKVFVLDNLSTGSKKLLHKNCIFKKLDINETKKIEKFIKKNKIKIAIHLAASLSVKESLNKPVEYFKNNCIGTNSLLTAFKNAGGKVFIFSSTCAVYGNVKTRKISEKNLLSPISNYARTKLISEQMTEYFSSNFNFNYGILRYFNVVGSDYQNNIGCMYDIGQLFKKLADVVLKKKSSFSIYGINYNTKDKTAIRDYIHVKDLSQIHIKTLKKILSTKKNILLNCGYGKGYSVLEVAKLFQKITKTNFKIEYKKPRIGDCARMIADNSKLKRILKFKPKYNNISKMISDTISWEKLKI